MQRLIISDTHLTAKFNPRLYRFLTKIIEPVDQVIINGDFWDGYFIDFNQFINSQWQQLFGLLKTKHTIYLAGNHDPLNLLSQQANLFSDQQLEQYSFHTPAGKFLVKHGHQLFPNEIDANSLVLRHRALRLFLKAFRYYENFQTRAIGYSLFDIARIWINRHYLKLAKAQLAGQADYIILGHSHLPRKKNHQQFFNSGTFISGRYGYLLIDDQQVSLKKGFY